jgi:NADP-dependent 3-hydroxy acid dehydrogenase YdfG
MEDLQGKNVLVTGGGSGIGWGIALALAQEGCSVTIAGRDEQKLKNAIEQHGEGLAITSTACDVSDRQQVARLFQSLESPVDILVNSAGINIANRSMAKLDPADWDRMMRINGSGAYYCMAEALPTMRERRSGLIVNISSIAGKRSLELAGVGYCASKFAMTALGTAVGLEERENGVRVTNIYPGEVETPILDARPVPVPAERRAKMVHPEDIAAMVVTIAKLPAHVRVPELVITPLYQAWA